MPGVVPFYEEGPVTYEVSTAVTGGQLVCADGTTGKVKPTTGTVSGGAGYAIGVATKDALPTTTSQTPTVTGISQTVNLSPLSQYVAVASEGIWPLTFTASANFGVKVKAAASGQVTPWVQGTDAPDLVVGTVAEAGGVSSGGTGAVKLSL